MTSAAPGQEPKLLDQVSEDLRTKHYSIRTEKSYIDWIYRFIIFHDKKHPREMGVAEISQFLTHLAVEKHVAPSTQNQALSAILFLYKEVLKIDLGHVEFTWAKKPEHLPVILSLEKDIDFGRNQVFVRRGKGAKDRVTPLPQNLKEALRVHKDLLCVRYRYDPESKRILKTIELIVEEKPWQAVARRIPMNKKMRVRVQYGEIDLGRQVKAVGGKWNRRKQAWEVPYHEVLRLGLMDRIME